MLPNDKFKSIIAALILISIFSSYYFFGKDIAKYVALASVILWLGAMFYFKKN